MSEFIALVVSALAAAVGWWFGRQQFRRGQDAGARLERQRTQALTQAVARQLRASDGLVQAALTQAQAREAQALEDALAKGPTDAQVQDLLDSAVVPTEDVSP